MSYRPQALGASGHRMGPAASIPAVPTQASRFGSIGLHISAVIGPFANAVVLPARHAYSHSASVGRRYPAAVYGLPPLHCQVAWLYARGRPCCRLSQSQYATDPYHVTYLTGWSGLTQVKTPLLKEIS